MKRPKARVAANLVGIRRRMPTNETHMRIEDYAPELLAYLRGRLGPADAEDVLQTVMLKATERLDTLRSESGLRGWLYQIARNALVDATRKAGREIPDAELDPIAEEVEKGACGCASSLTERLSPGQAQIIRLVDLDELGLGEVAERTGTSVNAATVQLHRARKRLRREVEELCGATDYASARNCECDTEMCS